MSEWPRCLMNAGDLDPSRRLGGILGSGTCSFLSSCELNPVTLSANTHHDPHLFVKSPKLAVAPMDEHLVLGMSVVGDNPDHVRLDGPMIVDRGATCRPVATHHVVVSVGEAHDLRFNHRNNPSTR